MILHSLNGLFRHKLRTLLILLGVMACFTAVTSVDGMLEYMVAERNQEITRFNDKVMLVSPNAGYPPFGNTVRMDSVISSLYRPDVDAEGSSPLLFIVLSPPEDPMSAAGITGIGMKPGFESVWIGSTMAQSGTATLPADSDDSVILGYNAAAFYKVKAAGETADIAGHKWFVAGILNRTSITSLVNIDNMVLMPIDKAQDSFHMEGLISALMLTPKNGIAELSASLSEEYPDMEVLSQQGIRDVARSQLSMPTNFLSLVAWASFAVAVMIIISILNIHAQENAQNRELLRLLGSSRAKAALQTATTAALYSVIGGACGIAAAIPAAYFLGWPWILNWEEILRIAGMVMACATLSSIYPAYNSIRVYAQAIKVIDMEKEMERIGSEKRAIDLAYRQLIGAREEERERLSRELHDEAIQSLVGLKFIVADKNPQAQQELQEEINKVIDNLRSLCTELRPPALHRLGLEAVLKSFADTFLLRSGIAVQLNIHGKTSRLQPDTELALFRIAQESLNNVWKHAKSAAAEVTLSFSGNGADLVIRDNGKGFSLPERLGELAEDGHFGLVMMHEHISAVGGTLNIKSELGSGTTITVHVPLNINEEPNNKSI